MAQDQENYATESSLPTVLMEFPVENVLPLTAVSGTPLEQILHNSENPNANALSELLPGSMIMINLPVIHHIATGITVYPLFTFSAFTYLPNAHYGSTLIATAPLCVNCLCPNCSAPTHRPPASSIAPVATAAPHRYWKKGKVVMGTVMMGTVMMGKVVPRKEVLTSVPMPLF